MKRIILHKKKNSSFPFVICLFLHATLNSQAADTWTNASGDGDWFNGDNWASGASPSPNADIYKDSDTNIIVAGAQEGETLNPRQASAGSFFNRDADIIVDDGGTITVTGAGDIAVVGYLNGEKASLTINNGGRVELTDTTSKLKFYIGLHAGTEGVVTVNEGGTLYIANGKSSEFTHAGVLNVGVGADTKGTLNVSGGLVDSRNVWLGGDTGLGTANVTSGTLKARSNLHIGNTNSSEGILNISGTGVVSGATTSIGNQAASKGTVNISGGSLTGTTMNIAWHTGSEGTLNAEGGEVTYTTINLGGGASRQDGDDTTKGYINLKKGGSIKVNTMVLGYYGYGELNIESAESSLTNKTGGAVTIKGGSGYSTYATANGVINFKHASGSVNFNHTIGDAADKIRVNHVSTGTTVLSGNSAYANGTYLSAGKIIAAHEKALGKGTLYVQGGAFHLDSTINTLSTGNINMSTGSINLHDGEVAQVNLTGAFEMTGGVMTLDILSENGFDYFTSTSGGVLSLAGGIIDLKNGYSGFEGIIGGSGNEFYLFRDFAAMGGDVIDGQGITINGYDKSNWQAKITTDGRLVFETIPIPEPSTLLFGLAGLVSLSIRRKR